MDQANWKGILAKNARDRDTAAVFKENISFSAGAPYERVVSVTQDTVVEQEYYDFIEEQGSIGGALEVIMRPTGGLNTDVDPTIWLNPAHVEMSSRRR